MPRGSLQILIKLFVISTFCLPESASASLVQVLDFLHHFSKRHMVEHHSKTYVHASVKFGTSGLHLWFGCPDLCSCFVVVNQEPQMEEKRTTITKKGM